jgi:hypothetical protein
MPRRKVDPRTQILTQMEVGRILKIPESAVAYLVKTKKLKGFTISHKMRFRPKAVDQYIKNCEQKYRQRNKGK